ncbi:MAG: hypothetical protein A2289_21310 [Deltaproteobacteria bacterium RIFOXYA12_FULL_58_15]|nr:MAG: hypothetical protein A2289_21310 [Deltaproteobacteria bacterium RIFOXYA12_FULL_58_15]OGR09740.1 MAG: hypothetical protein A2341_13065 [Deltaproteobacteria bacterium RIFOXYB12_FULL_58_9]
MRGVIVFEHGGIDKLHIGNIADPERPPGHALVEVRAVGINHLDLWVRRGVPGHVFPLPLIPGNDAAGVVSDPGNHPFIKEGDEVVVAPGVSCGHCLACQSGRDHRCRSFGILGESRHGGCAELLEVPSQNLFAKPASLSFETAAAVGIPYLTAWHMLIDRAQLRPGESVLVQAAGSGVSGAAIQIAKLWGAEVITTVGSTEKEVKARELGAQHVLNYSNTDVSRKIKDITSGRGVDVVIDHVGAATWEASLRSLAWHGRFVTCGATVGTEVHLNLRHLFFKSLSLLGSTMGSKAEFAEVLQHAGRGALSPIVDRVMPLEQIGEAHRLLEERRVFGKLVLKV